MPKVTAATLAVTVLIVLGLTGCTAAPESAPSEADKSVPSETVEPLVAETPDASDADEGFLAYVETERPANSTIANAEDEQLIAAGHEACAQIAAGVPFEDLRLVEGEEPSPGGDYLDTSAIFNGALYNYCPELIPDVAG